MPRAEYYQIEYLDDYLKEYNGRKVLIWRVKVIPTQEIKDVVARNVHHYNKAYHADKRHLMNV